MSEKDSVIAQQTGKSPCMFVEFLTWPTNMLTSCFTAKAGNDGSVSMWTGFYALVYTFTCFLLYQFSSRSVMLRFSALYSDIVGIGWMVLAVHFSIWLVSRLKLARSIIQFKCLLSRLFKDTFWWRVNP